MAASYWRDKSRRIIAERIAEAEKQGMDLAAMKRHIGAAFPFGLTFGAVFTGTPPAPTVVRDDVASESNWNTV